MAISRPRTVRQPRSFKPVRLVPGELAAADLFALTFPDAPSAAPAPLSRVASLDSVASPPTRAPTGNNPINASAIIVLPLPDSPTSPSDSPAAMRSDTSLTGRIQ